MHWLFIGAGNMASSLIGGLISGGTQAEQIAVVDLDAQTRLRAEQTFSVKSAESISAAIPLLLTTQSEQAQQIGVVLAVKPHIVQSVCEAFSQYLHNDSHDEFVPVVPLFVSVAAGVRESSMCHWLPEGSALVRCMPNTPALLGLGASALYANKQCSENDIQQAESLLGAVGSCIWVDTESELDAVTAVSGSGPAYFFYLIEHMTQAGIKLGLSEKIAEKLAVETAFGAASMAKQDGQNATQLRKNVTSEGGTTAAALEVFDKHKTSQVIIEALSASHDRAVEIGNSLS